MLNYNTEQNQIFAIYISPAFKLHKTLFIIRICTAQCGSITWIQEKESSTEFESLMKNIINEVCQVQPIQELIISQNKSTCLNKNS